MKTAHLLLTAAFCLNGFTSCMAGSSKKITETRPIQPYTSIQMDGVASVRFTQGNNYSLRIEGDEELVKSLITQVEDKTLIIDNEKIKWRKNRNNGNVTVFVTAPMLEKVSFDGVGSFKCPQKLVVEDFCIEKDGVGAMEINDLHCRDLEVEMDGVGSIDLHTECHDMDAQIDGVGGSKLTCKANHISIQKDGVGGAEINVDCQMLEADIDGVGGITFSGKAQQATFEKNGVGGFSTSKLKIGGK